MARGLRRGPVLLRFRSLVDSVAHYVAGIVDTRQLSKIRYTLRDCYLSAVALRPGRLAAGSSVAFSANSKPTTCPPPSASERSPSTPSCAISSTAMASSPSCPASPTGSVACSAANGSSTSIFDARYLITLLFQLRVGRAHCLTTTKNGTTRYHHGRPPSSTPTSVRCSLSLPSSYATVTPKRKQDCEITAGYRMLARLRADYPRMRQLSSPTAFTPSNRASMTAKRFSFLLVAKPGDHKSLYQDLAVLRRRSTATRHRQDIWWITDLPLNPNSPHIDPLAHPAPMRTPGSPT